MGTIFISYRREDSAGHAGRLYDYLRERPEAGSVFMDVSAIEPGVDFVDSIEKALGGCDLLIAMIGSDWSRLQDEAGKRRLDDPQDFIRLETATALKRGIRVIPVLVQGARLPHREELPEDLQSLVRRQAVMLRDDRWEDDVRHLIDQIAQAMRGTAPSKAVQPPPPAPEAIPFRVPKGVWIGLCAVVIAVGIWFAWQKHQERLNDAAAADTAAETAPATTSADDAGSTDPATPPADPPADDAGSAGNQTD